jgi:hypothetical protein
MDEAHALYAKKLLSKKPARSLFRTTMVFSTGVMTRDAPTVGWASRCAGVNALPAA